MKVYIFNELLLCVQLEAKQFLIPVAELLKLCGDGLAVSSISRREEAAVQQEKVEKKAARE